MNKHYSFLINPKTGDYILKNGTPVRDETLQFPCYARLKIKRNSWLYAPDSDYGSDFSQVRKRTATTTTLLESIGTKALTPLITDGRAVDMAFTSTDSSPRVGEGFLCQVVDSEKNAYAFPVTSVGD